MDEPVEVHGQPFESVEHWMAVTECDSVQVAALRDAGLTRVLYPTLERLPYPLSGLVASLRHAVALIEEPGLWSRRGEPGERPGWRTFGEALASGMMEHGRSIGMPDNQFRQMWEDAQLVVSAAISSHDGEYQGIYMRAIENWAAHPERRHVEVLRVLRTAIKAVERRMHRDMYGISTIAMET